MVLTYAISGGRSRRRDRNQHRVRLDGPQHEGRGLACHRGGEEDDLRRNQWKRCQAYGFESRFSDRVIL